MAALYESIHSVIWSEWFWFPPNRSWADMENGRKDNPYGDIRYPEIGDLWMVIPVAVCFILARIVLDRVLFEPLGRRYGLVKKAIRHPQNVRELHSFYKLTSKRPDAVQIETLADKLSWTTRRVERWFRLKRNAQKATQVKKFCEGSWRLLVYTVIQAYGVYVLYDEDFVFDVGQTLNTTVWPHFDVTNEFYWYYMLEMGFYVSLLISLAGDVRRSDFMVHVVHHIATLFLMVFSWVSNLVPTGMLVLALHDVSDIWLELCKVCKYVRLDRIIPPMFLIFFIIWVVTRLYLFPLYLVIPCWKGMLEVGAWPTGMVMSWSMVVLQVLHVVWTWTIVGILVDAVKTGGVEDSRSDSEASDADSPSSDDDERNHNGMCLNGSAVHDEHIDKKDK